MSDTEADIFEYLQSCRARGHGYVIRSGQDRALVAADGQTRLVCLHETARQQPLLERFALQLSARLGQRARVADLSISAVAVRLRAPQRLGASAGRRPAPRRVNTAARVWEADIPSAMPDPALQRARDHFHGGEHLRAAIDQPMVGGRLSQSAQNWVRVERLQLETAERLLPAVAAMSAVAMR